jgi:hypothetical protein
MLLPDWQKPISRVKERLPALLSVSIEHETTQNPAAVSLPITELSLNRFELARDTHSGFETVCHDVCDYMRNAICVRPDTVDLSAFDTSKRHFSRQDPSKIMGH